MRTNHADRRLSKDHVDIHRTWRGNDGCCGGRLSNWWGRLVGLGVRLWMRGVLSRFSHAPLISSYRTQDIMGIRNMKSLTEAKVNSSARIILYFFAFKAHNFFNKSLFDGSKSVVIVGCVL